MRFSGLAFLLLCANLQNEEALAFVPHDVSQRRTTTGRRLYAGPRSSLFADMPLPPPPPPAGGDNSNLVDGLMQQASKALENLQLGATTAPNFDGLSASAQSTTTQIQTQIVALKDQLLAADPQVLKELESTSSQLQSTLLDQYPQLAPFLQTLQKQLEPLLASSSSTAVALTVATLLTFMVGNFVLSSASSNESSSPQQQPYPNGTYDPDAAAAYFAKRLPTVLARGLSVLAQSVQFGLGLLSDKLSDKIADNEFQRGEELAQLLTKLGPTFIKVGQSLSIRTDLLSPAYIRGLATLQDQVPAFETSQAKRIMEAEWGQPLNDVLEGFLTTEPVAAASLGQVYKARLRSTGQDVAIKVQRPDITEQIALDMYLLRQVAPVVKTLFNLNSDTIGTVDAWGAGFVDELNYQQEAQNAAIFSERIAETPLADVVFAPPVVQDYSTRTVLVTEWVDGERLDRCSNADVTVLCSIAMNTYLTMLLESGTSSGLLHCDPHPGNLLRTKADGRLCILDWGMVTRIDNNLQLTLLEHMAHLTSADYAEIPKDLLLLGFIPPEKADAIGDSGVVDTLADIYGAWTKGGGAATINVNKVISQLQDLQAAKGNLFQIPPYFAYIAKSFSVLEGIGLSNDPKYSIINECLPYVSKRLLTDRESMGPALSTFIFGPDKHKPDRIVDYKRVEQLIEGFGDYSTSSSGALLGKESLSRTEILEESAEQILDLVFSDEETPLQQIMLDQLAKIVSAGGRSLFTSLRERSGTLPSGRTVLGTIADPLGLWRTSPLVRMNELDEKTIETTRKLVELMQRRVQQTNNPAFDLSNLSREEAIELGSILIRKVWDRRSGVLQTGNRFARKLLELTAEKLEIGERDTRTLPEPPAIEPAAPERTTPQALESASNVEKLTPASTRKESTRLQGARKLLEGLQDDAAAKALPEATPVVESGNSSQ